MECVVRLKDSIRTNRWLFLERKKRYRRERERESRSGVGGQQVPNRKADTTKHKKVIQSNAVHKKKGLSSMDSSMDMEYMNLSPKGQDQEFPSGS